MVETYKLNAFLVAYQLDIKRIKGYLDIKPLAESTSELFYERAKGKHQYYFNYGVIVFSGHTEDEMKEAINHVLRFQKNPQNSWLRDEFEIEVKPGSEPVFEFDKVVSGT